MLSLYLGQIIHAERQREIERKLKQRRLLEPYRIPECTSVQGPRIATRHSPARATS